MKLLAIVLLIQSASAALRGARTLQESNNDNFVLCRMVVVDTQFESKPSEENPACIPIDGVRETDDVINIPSLPKEIENDHRLEFGTLFVNITHAQIINNDIAVTPSSEFLVVPELPAHLRHLQQEPNEWTHGTKTVAFVRVATTDVEPTVTEQQLKNLFDDSEINFRTQYDKCSNGKLQWELADAGVIDVTLSQPMSAYGTAGAPLVSEAQSIVTEELNLDSIADLADKVVFCVARGPGSWVASAPMKHWRAQFHDEWCLSLTAMVHEIGHTIGLAHSNEGGVKYADTTSNMAKSYRYQHTPQRCFDGRNNNWLGWYSDRELELDSSVSQEVVNLAGFVEYSKTQPDEPVLVSVDEKIFIQYNLAKSFHAGTGEKHNLVTVANGTDLVAGLDVGESYVYPNYDNGNDLVVQVCQKLDGNDVRADAMEIVVGMGEVSCPEQSAEKETPAPTSPLARTPAIPAIPEEASEKETAFPTSSQTAFPTSAPTLVPTKQVVESGEKQPNHNNELYNRYNSLHKLDRNEPQP